MLGRVELLSRRMRHGGGAYRVPLCLDPAAIPSLVKQLRITLSTPDESTWTDPAATEVRTVTCIILRLLQINVAALEVGRLTLPDDAANELKRLLERCLVVDVTLHPHCLVYAKPVQMRLLRGRSSSYEARSKASTAQQLMSKYMSNDKAKLFSRLWPVTAMIACGLYSSQEQKLALPLRPDQ